MRILVADSDSAFASAVRLALRSEGLRVDIAGDLADALHRASAVPYEALIIDFGLPGAEDGALFRQLAARCISAPVLGLLSDPAPSARIGALRAGADDCLTKPFLIGELAARVHALTRRASRRSGDCLEVEDLVLHCVKRRAFRANELLPLTEREFMALECLVRAHGKPVSTAELLRQLGQGNGALNKNFIPVLIGRLRRKIDGPPARKLIRTIRGVGYAITAPVG